MLDQSGNGIKIVAAAPFSASALHYTIESLDEGWSKEQGHSQEVDEADLTNLCIDKVQAGLGCEDSWGRIARPNTWCHTLIMSLRSSFFPYAIVSE